MSLALHLVPIASQRLFTFRSDPRGTPNVNLGCLPEGRAVLMKYRCKPGGSIRSQSLRQ